jgi:Family of unknown function (DUF6461)
MNPRKWLLTALLVVALGATAVAFVLTRRPRDEPRRSVTVSATRMTGRDDHRWADEQEFDALTLAFVDFAGDPAGVFRAAGDKWESAPRGTFDDAIQLVDGFDAEREPVLVDRSGRWLILLAPNGYEFTFPGVAAGASRLGRVVTVGWNVNGVRSFLVADEGRLTRYVDDTVFMRDGEGKPLREEAGLAFEDNRDLLVLAERLTGVRVTADWMRQAQDTVILQRRTWAKDDPRARAVVPLD